MSPVKSTYNFVAAPTEELVFKPSWANQVSQDIPFEDGESGEIEVKIAAKTPIFVRNASASGNQDTEFSNVKMDGKSMYFIPATSLKGMTRNVLEIMSFSRLNKSLVNNDRYSFRDLSSAGNLYLTSYKKFKIRAGWLIQDESDKWKIEECEDLAFIDHVELAIKEMPFRNLFLGKSPAGKTAEYKYGLVKENQLNDKFTTFEKTLFGNERRTMAKYHDEGRPGKLVFTGQPSMRKEFDDPKRRNTGKFHEFVFFDKAEPTHLHVSDEMQKDFRFIYSDNDKNNISKDWKYWRNTYLNKNKKVPIFYSKNDQGKLEHFGLSYMYKLPYNKSILEMSPLAGYKSNVDLATTIFGWASSNDAMKGRVYFGNAFLCSEVEVLSEDKRIMGDPKASYFPFYLEQYKNSNTKTYNTFNDQANLRGFKRYPVHSSIKALNTDAAQNANESIFSSFKPLNEGCSFKFKIRFHNLKKVEIGALLSALTFHGNQEQCFHSLGGIKSFGFGKIKIESLELSNLKETKESYLSQFEVLMNDHQKDWHKHERLLELFAMSSNKDDTTLTYPSLKEFVSYKSAQDLEKLDSFSIISETNFKPKLFKSQIKKDTIQLLLKLDYGTFSDLSKELNRLKQEEYDEFTVENKKIIFESIKSIYCNHKDSKKKLSKMYDWDNNIEGWLGEQMTKELKEELKIGG
jgi:CRISPR-associated protein (TIGR03986 family)